MRTTFVTDRSFAQNEVPNTKIRLEPTGGAHGDESGHAPFDELLKVNNGPRRPYAEVTDDGNAIACFIEKEHLTKEPSHPPGSVVCQDVPEKASVVRNDQSGRRIAIGNGALGPGIR